MSAKPTYRPEIDGIRAIAVLSVIFYHAEFVLAGRDWLKGGFVGVDVFFVISGYLISKIIFSDIDRTGTFSFIDFYERRARRILPALFLVMAATMPFAILYLLPADLVHMANSQIASLAFSSNIYFYFTSTEYGAAPGLLMPFLHTWSLSVEEQFYLIFPLFVLVLLRFTARRVVPVAILLAASLASCLLLVGADRELAFFMPFTRSWEILAGSLLAIHELRRGRPRNRITQASMAVVGLLLVAIPMFAFNEHTLHPGALTIIPVVGTTLLLAFANERNLVGQVLSTRSIRYIGAISYSLYLWHYPIFALQRTTDFDFTNLDKAAGLALIFLVSVLSYHFVEQPFRRKRWQIWRPAGVLLALTVVIAGLAVITSGFSSRLDRVLPPTALEREQMAVASFTNFVGQTETIKPTILIVGDSYTTNWSVALNAFIDHDRFNVISVSYLGCEVNISINNIEASPTGKKYEANCPPFEKYINDLDNYGPLAAVFLTSHRPFEYAANAFRFDLLKWISDKAGHPDLFVFGNYFQLDGSPGRSSCISLMFHQWRGADICLELATYPPVELAIERLPLYPVDLAFTYVDLADLLCGAVKSECPATFDGMPFMRDWNHLTATFLIYAFDVILEKEPLPIQKLGLDQFLRPRPALL